MPDIRLTDAEREALASIARRGTAEDAEWLLRRILPALSAVPRLALASPMVAELVTLVHYGATHAQTDDEKVGILRRLAALTGEEATGGE